jgi:aldose 1-epimerase
VRRATGRATGQAAAPRRFGRTPGGETVEAVDLAAGGLSATVLTLGASLHDLRLDGADWPLTLGSDDLAAYDGSLRYAGAVVGPVANRIAGARMVIEGRACALDPNEAGRTTLHGGASGTHAQVWRIAALASDRVTLVLRLADGLGGGQPGVPRLLEP